MHTTGWLRWQDHDWKNEQNVIEHKSAGYVAQVTDARVSIMQSFQAQWEDGHPKHVDAIMTIPRKAITKFTVLKRAFNERNRKA